MVQTELALFKHEYIKSAQKINKFILKNVGYLMYILFVGCLTLIACIVLIIVYDLGYFYLLLLFPYFG